jgi:hypothetical protein
MTFSQLFSDMPQFFRTSQSNAKENWHSPQFQPVLVGISPTDFSAAIVLGLKFSERGGYQGLSDWYPHSVAHHLSISALFVFI